MIRWLWAAEESLNAVLGREPAIHRAESIAELAREIGVDADELGKTVEHYNRCCEEGVDRKRFKDKAYLVPFTRGPYYAVRAKLGTDGAFGGVLVNENMQAYHRDKSLIDGPYVVGDFASGRFINMAGVKVQLLNDMSWALSSGFLARTNAAKNLSDERQQKPIQ